MKPIRFIIHQDTVWYNITDYINLLLEEKSLLPTLPLLRKNTRSHKTPVQLVFDKLDKFEPTYSIRFNNELYIDWVIYEYFFKPLKPFLANPSDWRDAGSLFRQTQAFINESTLTFNRKTDPGTCTFFTDVSEHWHATAKK